MIVSGAAEWRRALADVRARNRAQQEQEEARRVREESGEVLAALPPDPKAGAHRRSLARVVGGPEGRVKSAPRAARDPLAYDGVIVPVLKKRNPRAWAC